MNATQKREVKFRKMDSVERVEDADVVIPREVVRQVQERFDNVLYGYFLGNRLPFPVVEYYVKNVWSKFGYSKLMMNSDGFFFFKFDTKEGMAKVLEGGPWLIRKVPLFLNVWSPSVSLKKEGIKTVPVWVKMFNVPISVYTDDGLSLLASKIGNPKRLDGYTADMCADSWGRSSFARALIEIDADNELKDHIVVAIPKLDDDGYVTERVKVEYEWQPHRCSVCCIFGHNDQTCVKNVLNKEKQVVIDEEGFTMDKRKVARGGMMHKKQKPKQKFVYRPKVNKYGPSTSGTKPVTEKVDNDGKVHTHNPFDALHMDDGDVDVGDTEKVGDGKSGRVVYNGKDPRVDEEVVEKVPTEMAEFMRMSENKLSVCALLESHVDIAKLAKVCKNVFRSWNWTSNGGLCDRGTRIILGWNADVVDIMILAQSDQVIHAQVVSKADNQSVFVSFVYAKNKYQERRTLWEDLCKHKGFCYNKPWVVMGDFNSALHLEDSLNGPSTPSIGMREFNECVQDAELMDIKGHGLHYTWNQKPSNGGGNGVGLLKKIDRVMGNMKFLELFKDAYVLYHPFRISDHTPCILKISPPPKVRPKPFKFANFITSKPEFRLCVEKEWAKRVVGYNMFAVTQKLRNLKPDLRKILFNQGNLHDKVADLRKQLDNIQMRINDNPLDANLRNMEAQCLQEFQIAAYDEECFLKQKAKVEWLCAGDSNTKFFHNSVKCRNARNKIHTIKDVHGTRYEGEGITDALVAHYANFLGTEDRVAPIDLDDIFVNKLSSAGATNMVRQVTREEVKNAMFSIGVNKAPGPDGYTSAFLLITDRIKGSLENLVSINQSAFVPGRKISDNILLTQELMHNYHLNKGPARCAFKIDIQKAYDTVSWSFLEKVLKAFGFHDKMVAWVMACVSTTSFSLSINGNLHGYFRGKRGLRQGDPMSPYLFTLVMEILSLLLQHEAAFGIIGVTLVL
ncbi:uncharacterized protein LOC110931782 [Helianthus annuus]|uniref:uncharacterized protein LOC110931782 n=1 Tax=Helianthus annuus TaxID=4232 RepID=UPI000B907A3F|nr:uncharacterized protein LOC110931782 [Helianthus annuus]